MKAIYHPETETVEVPVEVIERIAQRAARLEVLLLILKVLIDDVRREEQDRRWRVLWPTN